MAYYYSLLFRKRLHSLLLFFLLPSLHTLAEQDTGKITLNENNVQLEVLIRKIENQTGLSFTYATRAIDGKSVVPVIRMNRVSLDEVLGTLFKGKNITWKVSGKTVVLLPGTPSANDKTPESKADTIPQVTIKGTVTAEEGFPLPGATVLVKGTDRGTTTDNQGRFSLTGIPARSVVEVRYTGYAAQEFNVRESETLVAKLKRAVGALDEQVVIAYGTSSRRLLTGSVGRVTAKDIEHQPVSNPLAALYGRVPGLTITQQTGVPGGNFKIEIRGQNSLRNIASNNGNIPLYIIDGVPFSAAPMNTNASSNIYPLTTYSGSSPFNSINPADIESIEILKDADATAIYGSRGANGVILISTKKGHPGKLKVDANIYHGASQVTRRLNLLNTSEYIRMRKEAFQNDGLSSLPSSAYDINGTWDTTKQTDWQKELIGKTASMTDAQLSFSGGSTHFQYRFGGGYHRETTVFPGDFSDKRYTAHISLSHNSSNNRFRSLINSNYSIGTTNLLVQDITSRALIYVPNAPDLIDHDGNLNWPIGVTQNPLQYTKCPYDAKSKTLIANAMLQYEVAKGLFIKSNFGYTTSTRREVSKTPISSLLPSIQSISTNISLFGNTSSDSWSIEPQLSYQKNINGNNLTILIGSTFQSQESESLFQTASGFASESLMNNVGAVPGTNVSNSYGYQLYRYNAIFGRLNYDFKRKYLLTLTGRRDGSSRFGPGKQFSNFGSVGLGWVFSEENFIKEKLSFLSYGKVRASHGTSGNDQTPNYGFLDLYTPTLSYMGQTGLGPKQLFNADYAWELNKKNEIALETGFLDNRILLNVAYYRNRSSNQLVGYPLPPTTGFTTIQTNLNAIVENKGFEFELKISNENNRPLKWSAFLNLTLPKNRLVSYPNIESSSFANTYVVGQPLSILKLYKHLGVNPSTGLYQVEDLDKNNIYNVRDMQSIKHIGSKLYGGVGGTIEWKGINLDLLFQFTKQDGRSFASVFTSPPGFQINQPKEVLDRWTSSQHIDSHQKFTQNSGTSYSLYINSDAIITDASYLRLKNVSISYQIPPQLTNKFNIKIVRFYLQGQNLITLTRYKGLDPETQGASLPPLTTYTGGIQITL